MTQVAQEKIHKIPTQLPHIFKVDIDDSGLYQEVAIVKEEEDGTIYYIKIDGMHIIDKRRLKNIVSQRHADREPLYEIMSRFKLDMNEMNALDFFHFNYVKVKRPRGAMSRDSLVNLKDVAPSQNSTLSNGPTEIAKSSEVPAHVSGRFGGGGLSSTF